MVVLLNREKWHDRIDEKRLRIGLRSHGGLYREQERSCIRPITWLLHHFLHKIWRVLVCHATITWLIHTTPAGLATNEMLAVLVFASCRMSAPLWINFLGMSPRGQTPSNARNRLSDDIHYPVGTRRCCDVESTSLTLIQRRNNVGCPAGTWDRTDLSPVYVALDWRWFSVSL